MPVNNKSWHNNRSRCFDPTSSLVNVAQQHLEYAVE